MNPFCPERSEPGDGKGLLGRTEMNRPKENLPPWVQFNPSYGIYGVQLAAYLDSLPPAEHNGHVMVVYFPDEFPLLIVNSH